MKKILFILLCMPAILASAANENPKYLRGAVPERDGIVTFTQTFSVPGKNQADIYPVVKTYIQQLVTNARQDLRTRIVSDQDNTIVANVEEIMTFRKKFLNWDHCFFRYLISAQCTPDSKVTLTITKISYQYQFDNEGNGGENFKAEEWISDAAAVNKAGTKLYPRCGKFRRKTIDRVEEIFTGARDAFETPAAPVAPQPKATVVE
ncbi:MAG: DUF4468 domain-containing protein [Bacteroidaceae bacterium]|nr:DUF4468 domain-containing protein [Bacteroidaceae bacterium]MBQ8937785.1 DUF4468 domain-containing protein [Bacteroidaceae bacterium]MBQ9191629.1 DUF4468 domain-containing protein [Bacteroidaceae bacterium]